ncbi:MAG: hypothetical protein V1855_05145, partial [bacterium]
MNKENKDDFDDFIETPIDAELAQQAENKEQERENVIEFKLDNRRDERVVAFNLIYAIDRASYDIDLSEVVINFEHGF